MTTVLVPTAIQKFFDNSGAPLAAGKVFTYQAGTTTPLATYTDSTGATQNANPIVLSARGEAGIWINPNVAYKFNVQDSLGNQLPGWPIDNIVSSQLITLYGGVDTGVANAYVLTFTANFSAYADGIVIYWIAAHANTGASTINVNGLGVVNLVNQSGSALLAGQIANNQVVGIIFKGGQFLLLTSTGTAAQVQAVDGTLALPSIAFLNDTGTGFWRDTFYSTGQIGISLGGAQQGRIAFGSFTPTWTGFSAAPTGTIGYMVNGHQVIWQFGVNNSGTSNSTSFSLGNIPAVIRPVTSSNPVIQFFNCQDNGAQTIATGNFTASGASLVFWKGTAPPSSSGWTNSGTKGFLGTEILTYWV